VTASSSSAARCRAGAAGAPGASSFEAQFARARRQGIRRHVGLIAEWNRPSLAWAAGLGWSQLGAIGYRWTLRGRRYFVEGALRLDGGEVVVLPPAPVESRRRA
jgi:hypothetical protein